MASLLCNWFIAIRFCYSITKSGLSIIEEAVDKSTFWVLLSIFVHEQPRYSFRIFILFWWQVMIFFNPTVYFISSSQLAINNLWDNEYIKFSMIRTNRQLCIVTVSVLVANQRFSVTRHKAYSDYNIILCKN